MVAINKMTSSLLYYCNSLWLLLAVINFKTWSSHAHPNAACQVSSHTTLAATSETDSFVNPQATAIGLDVVVVYVFCLI